MAVRKMNQIRFHVWGIIWNYQLLKIEEWKIMEGTRLGMCVLLGDV